MVRNMIVRWCAMTCGSRQNNALDPTLLLDDPAFCRGRMVDGRLMLAKQYRINIRSVNEHCSKRHQHPIVSSLDKWLVGWKA